MSSSASTREEYIATLSDDRREVMQELRKVILANLPGGFSEVMSYGMIGYVVPHSVYPKGYHCDPEKPLPFMSNASQKSYVPVYHIGVYADGGLLNWFNYIYVTEMKTKPDMGKSCIRFKKPEQISMKLIGELASKMSPEEWIAVYESKIRR